MGPPTGKPTTPKNARRRRLMLAAGVAVALVAYLLLKSRGGDGGQEELAVGAAGPAPESVIDAGATSGAADTAAYSELLTFTDLLSQRLASLETGQASLQDYLTSASLYSGDGGYAVDYSYEEPAPLNEQGPSGQTPAASPGNRRTVWQTGVAWGGTIYASPGMGSEFIAEHLRPKGVNPQQWAQKHPEAAAYLGIPQTAPKKTTTVAKPAAAAKPAAVKPTAKPAAKPARYYTYKKDVPLKPGQKLKFTTGKGYYAG